jgi:hypothetical protein
MELHSLVNMAGETLFVWEKWRCCKGGCLSYLLRSSSRAVVPRHPLHDVVDTSSLPPCTHKTTNCPESPLHRRCNREIAGERRRGRGRGREPNSGELSRRSILFGGGVVKECLDDGGAVEGEMEMQESAGLMEGGKLL